MTSPLFLVMLSLLLNPLRLLLDNEFLHLCWILLKELIVFYLTLVQV